MLIKRPKEEHGWRQWEDNGLKREQRDASTASHAGLSKEQLWGAGGRRTEGTSPHWRSWHGRAGKCCHEPMPASQLCSSLAPPACPAGRGLLWSFWRGWWSRRQLVHVDSSRDLPCFHFLIYRVGWIKSHFFLCVDVDWMWLPPMRV